MFRVNKTFLRSPPNFQLCQASLSIKTYEAIPGPKPYPIIGNLLDTKPCGGQFDVLSFRDFIRDLHDKYGEIVRWSNPEFDPKKWTQTNRNVYLSNPEHVKKVFKADGTTPVRPELEPLNKLHRKLGIETGLVNSQYERWRILRSASNPIIARPQMVQAYLPNQNEVADEFVRLISEEIGTCSPAIAVFDGFEENLRLLTLEFCQKLLRNSFNNIFIDVSEITFNQKLKCMDKRTRAANVTEFVQAVDDFSVYSGRLVFSAPLWKVYATEDWRSFEKAGVFMYRECRKYIEEAEVAIKNSDQAQAKKATILGQYLDRKEMFNLSTNDVVSVMSEFLIGGVDTTAVSLYYLLYELGSKKDIQNKLYNEISSILKPDEQVTEEHLVQFKYLKWIVKESQRLHAVAPSNSRVLQQDLVLENYFIPKGTHMLFSNAVMTRSEKYFKEPLVFDPDRWNEDSRDKHHLFASLPFGNGIRMCLGQRIALQEIYLTIIKLIQNFEVTNLCDKVPGFKIALIASPDISLNIAFAKR